jgi:sporulation integral membrane protein YtvI
LIAVVITLVASCFMTTEFPKVMQFFRLQVPERRRNDLDRAKVLLKSSLGKMGKAYALIMLVTFIEMSLGLTVLRLIGVFQSNYIIMIAAVTAIIDIVPVLGTGTVLLPWAAYSLITGSFGMGIGLLVLYAAITVIRQVIEPKLVAGQLGLSPIVTIAALYFGLKIFGVLGMLITPVLVIMLKLLNDEGIIHLWRSPARARKEAAAAAAAAPEAPAEEPAEETDA